MNHHRDTSPSRRPPIWVFAIMFVLALIEPLTHAWLTHAPPQGYVSTGLHTRETVFLRYWMRPADWPSPFSLDEDTAWSINAPRIFFGAAGTVGRTLGFDDFTTLGWLNGLGMLVLLLGVTVFLRIAAPRVANLAFLVYALAGGLGGVLYIIAGALGLHDSPNFEAYFQRYAHYELFQGKFLTPAPLMVYPHYTFPLGLGFAALALAIRAVRDVRVPEASRTHAPRAQRASLLIAAILLFLGGTLNVRLGPMIWAIYIGYLLAGSNAPMSLRIKHAAILAVPAWAAFLVAWLPIYLQSGSLANQIEYGSAAVWFSPLISAAVFHLVTVPLAVRHELPGMRRWQRACVWAAIGYLAIFTILYLAHAVYYGNLLLPNDTSPPLKFSDTSLLGAVLGVAWALVRRPGTRASIGDGRVNKADEPRTNTESDYAWIVLWFLAFLVFSISAFGRGTWLMLTPQRLMVFYGVPLAILSAHGIVHIYQRRPIFARAVVTIMVVSGVLSIAVGAFAFRGPLGARPGEPPYGAHHAELMREDDAMCFPQAGPGFILAPLAANPTFGDIAAVQRPDVTVFGVGSFGLSGLDYGDLEAEVTRFFTEATPEDERRAFVEQWHVDWIYVSATPNGYGPVAEELAHYTWLETTCEAGDAALFRVTLGTTNAVSNNGT